MIDVRRATPTDAPAVVDILTEAFFDDPVAEFLFSDPTGRRRLLSRFFVLQLERNYLRRGLVLLADDAGAALWLPPGAPAPTVPERLAHARFSLRLGERRQDAKQLTALLEVRHPSERHWYLGALGVRPDRQRQGVGSALLAAGLIECDAGASCAYLEASRPESARLYARFGFQVSGIFSPSEWGLPGPVLTLMTRPTNAVGTEFSP